RRAGGSRALADLRARDGAGTGDRTDRAARGVLRGPGALVWSSVRARPPRGERRRAPPPSVRRAGRSRVVPPRASNGWIGDPSAAGGPRRPRFWLVRILRVGPSGVVLR